MLVITQLERPLLGQIHAGGVVLAEAIQQVGELLVQSDGQAGIAPPQFLQMFLRKAYEQGEDGGRRGGG